MGLEAQPIVRSEANYGLIGVFIFIHFYFLLFSGRFWSILSADPGSTPV